MSKTENKGSAAAESLVNSLKGKRSRSSFLKKLSSETCSICTNEYDVNESLHALECGHVYHAACVVEWLRRTNTCPLCRRALYQQPPPEDHDNNTNVGTGRTSISSYPRMSTRPTARLILHLVRF